MHMAKGASVLGAKEDLASEVVKEEQPMDPDEFIPPVLFSFSQQEVTKTVLAGKALTATLQKTIPFTFGGNGEWR